MSDAMDVWTAILSRHFGTHYKQKQSCCSYTIYEKTGVNLHFENVVAPNNPLQGTEREHRKEELKKIAQELHLVTLSSTCMKIFGSELE